MFQPASADDTYIEYPVDPLGVGAIVVLDGPDCAGKSTLARTIADMYNGTIIHLTYRWRKKMHLYHLATIRHAARLAYQGRVVVIDRWWPSEVVYANVLRGGSDWPLLGRILERLALRFGVYHALCLPGADGYLGRYVANIDPAHPYTVEQVERLYRAYLRMWEGRNLATPTLTRDGQVVYGYEATGEPVFTKSAGVPVQPATYEEYIAASGGFSARDNWWRYDLEQHRGVPDVAAHTLVTRSIRRRRELTPWQLSPRNQAIAGNVGHAPLIMVGDRSKAPYHGDRFPFCTYRNSSLHLAKALNLGGLDERAVAWLNVNEPGNANELSGTQLLEQIRLVNPQACYVALGIEASDTLQRFGVLHTRVHHPQYERRFKRDLVGQYGQQLVTVAATADAFAAT